MIFLRKETRPHADESKDFSDFVLLYPFPGTSMGAGMHKNNYRQAFDTIRTLKDSAL